MKKNQGQKTNKSLKSNHHQSHKEQFSGVMFDHITGKNICLKCNAVGSSAGRCSHGTKYYYYLGKIARTPKANASRAKWKSFYSYLMKTQKGFRVHPEFSNIVAKYNLNIESKVA